MAVRNPSCAHDGDERNCAKLTPQNVGFDIRKGTRNRHHYGEKKKPIKKNHIKEFGGRDAPEASQGQTRDVPGTPGTFGPDLCLHQYQRARMSPGQTGHITGQMGLVPGTDGTHTRECPAKILYVYWFFSFPTAPFGKFQGFAKGWFPKGWLRAVKGGFGGFPLYRKTERGYKKRNVGTENRNEGTKTRTKVPKTGTGAHSPKPPSYNTALFLVNLFITN